MNPTPYGPKESHLRLVGKITPKTWENCREMSEGKAPTNCHNDLVDLLIELAMERENDSHMHKYLRRDLQRETPTEKCPGGSSSQRQSNPGKGQG